MEKKQDGVLGTSSYSDRVEEVSPLQSTSKEATRTLLEDVCADFETMDVMASKNIKTGVTRNPRRQSLRQQMSRQQSSGQKNSTISIIKYNKPPDKSLLNNEVVDEHLLRVRNKEPENVVHQNEIDSHVDEIPVGPETLPPQHSAAVTAVISTACDIPTNSELLPLSNCQNSGNIAILSEGFVGDANGSNVAEVADAEVVQSGDNLSIIVTNHRFIELNVNDINSTVAALQPAAVIESPATVLETETGTPTIINSAILANNVFQGINIIDDASVIQENVISVTEGSCSSSKYKVADSPKKGRGRSVKKTIPPSVSSSSYTPSAPSTSSASKARRVTAKMRQAWAAILAMDRKISCQMPGCSQSFNTIANFQIHYKYCTGKKTLQKCDYCESMIFSTYKAMLQHMEFAHPEKVDEFRASHPDEETELEKTDSLAQLLVSEDENVAMNVEEVTQQPKKFGKKRKLSPKEIPLPPRKVILKHKLQSIQNSMAENAKQFKKCVRFDTIADTINSVEDVWFDTPTTSKEVKRKEKKKRPCFTERIVAENKYFEDDEDEDADVDMPKTPEELEREEQENLREKMHTKARMVLNLDRYKRYQEYLTVTRDWSSERKTYSRSRGSDVSSDNSLIVQMQNESFHDIHRLNETAESSSISLDTSQTEINAIQMSSPDTYQVLVTPEFISAVPVPCENIMNELASEMIKSSKNMSIECHLSGEPNFSDSRLKREKTACYNRITFETPKPKLPRYGGVITYGITVPGEDINNIPIEPPITFDSLVDSMKTKSVQRNSQSGSDKDTVACGSVENISNHTKEDGIKLPGAKVGNSSSPKKNRRAKSKADVPINAKGGKMSKKQLMEQRNKRKKYSAAMLKTIEMNTKNRKIKLFGVKKNSKFKSKAYVKSSRIQSKKSNVKRNKMKQTKRNFLAKRATHKKKSYSKTKSIDESAIQCQENIDNHLLIGQELENIPHIPCLSVDHNYTQSDITANIIEEGHLIVDENIAGEIEVVTSVEENLPQSVTENSEKSSENVPIEVVNSVTQETTEPVSTDTSCVNSEVMPKESEIDSQSKINTQSVVENSQLEKLELTDGNKMETVFDQNINDGNDKNVDSIESLPKDSQKDQNLALNIEDDISINPEATVPVSLNQNVESLDNSYLQERQMESEPSKQVECIQNTSADIPNLSISKSVESDDKEKEFQDTSAIMEHTVTMVVSESVAAENADGVEKLIQEVANADSTQEVENATPEVVVKRRRGRPKRSTNKKSQSETSVNESPQQDTSSLDKLAKSKVEVTDNQTAAESLAEHSLVADDNKPSPAVRKSERVKRRKLIENEMFQTPVVEAKPIEEENTLVTRTRRRGRSRKCSPKDSPMELTKEKVEEIMQKAPEIESEVADENSRKYSRKGRPRKCVRYADLNTGVDSSESLDGTNSGSAVKAKPEGKSKSKKNAHKSVDAKDEEESVKETNKSDEQEEKVLPLKKRKQRQPRKDASEVGNNKSHKNVLESKIILADEEAMQKSEDDEETPGRNSRNLRNNRKTKTPKRKKHGKEGDSSDEEWRLSDHIDSKQTRASRHRSSRKGFIELDEDSEEFSGSEKGDPTVDFSKKMNDSPSTRRFNSKTYSRAKPFKVDHLKYFLKTTEDVLKDYKPLRCMWKLLSNEDYVLPPLRTSAYFKTEKYWMEKESYWNCLSLFDSAPLDKDSCHATFFTGGPITSSAWCPVPVDGNKIEYVALAVNYSLNKIHSYLCQDPEKGLLQLWNVGALGSKMLQRKPFMEMGIYHEWGPITAMAWCPYGCWEDPAAEFSDDVLPRLGLLAAACSDGYVRIYSIPHPQFLPKEGTCFPVYPSCPSITLEPLYGGICTVTRQSMCISLSWQKSDLCEYIAAGYGNGMICMFHINSSGTILAEKKNNQTIINPYLAFSGHGTPVTSVSLSPLPGCRFLVSSSIDKTLKFWDLVDTSLPFFAVKKGAGRYAEWSRHYCGAFGSIEYGMNNYKGSTFFKECGTEAFSSRTLSNPCCSVIANTLSQWLNAHALADVSGNVSVSFNHNLLYEHHPKSPQYFHRVVYECKLEPVEGILEKIMFSSYQESVSCLSAIQELKEAASLLNKVVTKACEATDIDVNSLTQLVEDKDQKSLEPPAVESFSEMSGKVGLMTVEEMKDVISVVHDITTNCDSIDKVIINVENSVVSISEDTIRPILVEESSKECCETETKNDASQITGSVHNKLSDIADIITLITDIKDVTHTVDELVIKSPETSRDQFSSPKMDVNVSESSLMEVDECDLNSSVPNSERESDILPANLSDPVIQNSDVIHLFPDIVEVINTLVNGVEVVTACDSKADSQMIENVVIIATDEDIIANIQSENIACISTLEEITNVVTVMEHVTEKSNNKEFSGSTHSLPDKSEVTSKEILKCSRNEQTVDMKHFVAETELSSDSNITDVVAAILDVKDTTEAVMDMNDATALIIDIADEAVMNVEYVAETLSDTKEVAETLSDMKETAAIISEMKETAAIISDMKETAEIISDMKDTAEIISDMKDATDIVMDMRDTAEIIMDIKDTAEVVMDMKDTADVVLVMKDTTEVIMDMKDTAELVMDMKDTAEVVMAMKDTTDVMMDMKDTAEIMTDMKDTAEIVLDMKDIVGSLEDLKDITAVTEKLESDIIKINFLENQRFTLNSNEALMLNKQQIFSDNSTSVVTNSDNATQNYLLSEVTAVLGEIIKDISEKIDTELSVKGILNDVVSIVQLMNKLEECESQKSSVLFDNAGCENNLAEENVGNSLPSDACIELISSNPIPVSSTNVINCNGHVPEIQTFDHQLELPNEIDEQILPFDSESSEDDMDTEDEINNSYLLDQDSNLSDDSILSECSLASIYSFSTESDASEASFSSIHGDKDVEDPVSSVHDDTVDVANASSETIQATEMPCDSPVENEEVSSASNAENMSMECDSDLLVSEDTLDIHRNSKASNSELSLDKTDISSISDAVVPDPHCDTISEDVPVTEEADRTIDSLCSSEVVPNSEIPNEVLLETVSVSDDPLPEASSDRTMTPVDIGNSPDDTNSCNIETAKVSESYNRPCTESDNKTSDSTDGVNMRESVDICDSTSALPKTVKLFDTSEITETVVVNSKDTNEISTSIENECIVDSVKNTSPEKLLCEDVISQYGIVFTDMNTAKFDTIENRTFEELDDYSLNQCHLTSIKTVSWNPNFGSHNWLFSAGQSGIARLSYISDINQSSSKKKRKASDV